MRRFANLSDEMTAMPSSFGYAFETLTVEDLVTHLALSIDKTSLGDLDACLLYRVRLYMSTMTLYSQLMTGKEFEC